MNNLIFAGCASIPINGYFKGLGIFRLIVTSGCDAGAKAFWDKTSDRFVLKTNRTDNEIEKYFLYEYQPTPLIAPWNGSTGFYPKDNKNTINAIINSQSARFGDYQRVIAIAQKVVDSLQLAKQPTGSEKQKLLQKLRNNLPDIGVKWVDTCALVTSEELKFPPLLGTGGNDGNFEFSRTFMQQLQEIFDFATGQPNPKAIPLLKASLWDECIPGLQYSGKIGQFNPIASGGANATTGYEGDARVNPWDFALMLEGIMMFAAAATRRYESGGTGEFTYPFTVRPVNVGYGSAAKDDSSRGEIWIPLWEKPAGYEELQIFFNEGRVKIGKKTARDGLDFVQAMSDYAVKRNIFAFVRYSFQERNGLSYFAIPLGKFAPQLDPNEDISLIGELESWLRDFDRKIGETPDSVKAVHRKLKTILFNFCTRRNNTSILDVLTCLGEVEATLSNSLESIKKLFIKPVPLLDNQWLAKVKSEEEGSLEFRLALSLISPEFRKRLVPIAKNKNFVAWEDDEKKKYFTTWTKRNLTDNLIILLKRQEIEALQQQKTAATKSDATADKVLDQRLNYANFQDIQKWLYEEVDDRKIEAIARGLSLININTTNDSEKNRTEDDFTNFMPISYAVIKLAHQDKIEYKDINQVFRKQIFEQDVEIKYVPELLNKLMAGDMEQATKLAIRRLESTRLQPVFSDAVIEDFNIKPKRLAAALAFPISSRQTANLLYLISKLRFPENDNN